MSTVVPPSSAASLGAPFSPHTSEPAPRTGAGGHLRFRPDIEGLRALAIAFVVLYHAGWGRAGGGYLGVDVFFVLSGFLISGILVDEATASGHVSLMNFWARRARRLLPAAAVVTFVVLALNAVLLSPFEQIARAETAQAFAAYGSNILFAVRSTDYFGGAATRDQLLHTWSLSVEEQFYLFFAPLMLLLAVWTRKRGTDAFRRRLGIATVALSLASLVGGYLWARQFPVIAFFALPARVWEFGLGALSLLVVRRMTRVNGLLLEAVALAGILGLLASAVLFREGRVQPLGPSTLVPTLSTVALILTGAGTRQTLVARVLSWAPTRLFGRLSYSWYLWHWPVLVYLHEVRPDASVKLSIAVAMLSLIPAAITYRFIESPVRFSSWLQRRATLAVVGAIVLAGLTYAAGAAAIAHANNVLATPRYAAILATRLRARVYDEGCQVALLATDSPTCRYGPGTNDTSVVLFGDSHAAHWFPAFDSVAALRGWTLYNLTKTGCPATDVRLNNLGRRYVECETWRKRIVARIDSLKPTMVVLVSGRSYNVPFGDRLPHTDSSGLARREWSEGLTRTLTALRPSAAQLVVLEDTPWPGFDVPRCLVKYIDEPSRCEATRKRALNPLVAGSELAAARAVPGTAYLSMNDFLCDSLVCPVTRDGVVRYQDTNHMTIRFAASLAPELSTALSRVLGARTAER